MVGSLKKRVLLSALVSLVILFSIVQPAIAGSLIVKDFEDVNENRLIVDEYNSYDIVNGVNGSALYFDDNAVGYSAYYIVANTTEYMSLNPNSGTVLLHGGYFKIISYGNDGVGLFAYGDAGTWIDSSTGGKYRLGYIVLVYYNASSVKVDVVMDYDNDGSGNVIAKQACKADVELDNGWHSILVKSKAYRDPNDKWLYHVYIYAIIIDGAEYTCSFSGRSYYSKEINQGFFFAGSVDKYVDNSSFTWYTKNFVGEVAVDNIGVYTDETTLPPGPTETVTYTTTVTKVTNTTITKTVTSENTIVKTVTIEENNIIEKIRADPRLIGLGITAILVFLALATRR